MILETRMKNKPSRSKSAPPRHRSPVPPPGGPMAKKGYDRLGARKNERKAVSEALPEDALRNGAAEAESRPEEAWEAEEE
jgi:hypothetical protein